ncbi:MAG: ATP-dependent RecD-like DNA helicase [Lentisphaerota bacterium]
MDLFSEKNNSGPLTEQTLRGEIDRIVYENEDNSYMVMKIRDAQGVEHTAVGNVSGAYPGHNIEVVGHWEQHQEYGRQLRIENFKFVLPSTREGIVKYLSSGILPGIGPKLAECIVNHFGDKTLEVLSRYSARLKEIPGVGPKRIEMIRDAWQKQASRSDIFIFMQSLGITMAYCRRLYKQYGDATAEVIKTNPYRLADEIDGIGFIMSDRIAASLGIEKNDVERLAAGAYYTMNQLTQAGHCCYPESEFIKTSAETLNVNEAEARLGVERAVEKKQMVITAAPDGTSMIYSTMLYNAERELPRHIAALAKAARHRGELILKVPPRPDLKLSNEQLTAVEQAGHSALNIITGGPGVGKTTVVGEIVRRAVAAKLKVFLAAPTGRAAKKMSEATNFPSRTIHRLLKWEPVEKTFVYGLNYKLPCDVLIVDEVSMLDIHLALCLFRAIKPGTTVIMVGDSDQLPSVGPGQVLQCFLNCGLFAVTHLSKIFRQGAGSQIITNAHNVNHGLMPELENPQKDVLGDFYWIEQDDPEKTIELIIKMTKERIPERFGLNPVNDIQILTPMNRGTCGTAAINEVMQKELNPGSKPQFKAGERTFKAGDKVMQTSNNYDKNVFNGDMGRIAKIDMHENRFSVVYEAARLVEYEFFEADQLTLSYAITVHKSQGSEFPAVIIPLLTQHYMMLQRNLLYTAMTRARQLLVLIGSRKAVAMAVKNSRLEPRFTLLTEYLRDIAGKK